ncbi:MAG: YjjI family glycine radical enzyme [Eubacteriales bacterium]
MGQLKITEEEILEILQNNTLTHEQMVSNLAGAVMNGMTQTKSNDKFFELHEKGWLCDMGEGYAPYCPRYILPDYEKFFQTGCEFLRLAPPTTMREAILALEIFYRYVPSVTHYPVYLGRLDKLLEPFVTDYDHDYPLIEDFLVHIDGCIPDSFSHANIGPEETVVGNIILDVETKLKKAIPSLTILYDPDITPDEFGKKCVLCELACAKPSFANHKVYSEISEGEYGIASCYNALPVGGGAFTLSRLVLKNMADSATNKAHFFEEILPLAVRTLCEFIEEKITFMVEKTNFFPSSFLVKEGFLSLERFSGMFGMVGLNECVNILMQKEGKTGVFGYDSVADDLGEEILQAITDHVNSFESKYCHCSKHHFMLHAQVGTDFDIGISAGVRISIGDEPPLYEHITHAGRYHPYFTSGVGDIFPFDEMSKKNPEAILDIVKGAFSSGMRYFSTYCSDCDVVRVTGYLVKRSDMDKLASGEAVGQSNAIWGLGSRENNRSLDRMVRNL